MANSPQARKRVRQAERHRARNASMRSMYRTFIKKVETAIDAGDADGARSALATAIPVIDKMVTKGIMHKNKAARHKTRLHRRIGKLAG